MGVGAGAATAIARIFVTPFNNHIPVIQYLTSNDSSFSDVRNNVGSSNRITNCKYLCKYDKMGYDLSFPTDIM